MQLIYTDESGINYSNTKGLFKDGPYIFYGGICIDENKYFHLERMFIDLVKTIFSIEDWRAEEVHASNIWSQTGHFGKFQKETIKDFFEELLQMLTKLDIQTIIGCQLKTVGANAKQRALEEAYSIYAFIHGVELHLSKRSETGVIIADQKTFNSDGSLFSKLFSERSRWRTAPGVAFTPTIKSKYFYESRLCFLIDNIHYVNSKESLFNQIADIVLFIIMRVWTYQNLRIKKTVKADINKVPISVDTFQFFASRILTTTMYDQNYSDVYFDDLKLALDLDDLSDKEFFSDDFFEESFCKI